MREARGMKKKKAKRKRRKRKGKGGSNVNEKKGKEKAKSFYVAEVKNAVWGFLGTPANLVAGEIGRFGDSGIWEKSLFAAKIRTS